MKWTRFNLKPKAGGLFIPRYCKCGKYEPISESGLIISTCKNCGGQKRPVIFGKGEQP